MSSSETSPVDARVALLLTNRANDRLVADALDAETDSLGGDDPSVRDADADLLVVDAAAFERHRDAVAAFRAADPLPRPVLLLLPEGQTAPAEAWETIDDVVSMPVRREELLARVENTLDRRGLERDLAASEARFRTLFETAPDPAAVVENGVVVDANGAFARLVGVEEEDTGRRIESFDAFPDSVTEALTSDEVQVVTYTSGGETRFAECNSRELQDGGRIALFRDVTDRVNRERELERQVERLDEFGRVLAHEIRNPLAVADGWLQEGTAAVDDDAAAILDRVGEAHDRMQKMVDELLALARQGEIVGETTTQPLGPLVRSAWTAIATPGTILAVTPAADEWQVTADPDRLREVFENLFRNSVEHGSTTPRSDVREDAVEHGSSRRATDEAAEHGGESVRVEVGLLDDGTGFYVADDGVGIPAEERERIFESGVSGADGTGFGLAIVRQIVAAHGWTITAVESEDGGARFEVTGVGGA